jgi:hypothetical protein
VKIGILVKIDRDASGHFEAPVVTAHPTLAEAQDAMLADFAKTKAERFPKEGFVFDDACDSDEAYIVGTDDSVVSWWAFEREVSYG